MRGGGRASDIAVILASLRLGECCDDALFDQFLPERDRRVAGEYWTPLSVVARITRWLVRCEVGSVVDVGSGVGKFCVAAALGTLERGVRFTGLEERTRLVDVARTLARRFDVADRVEFVKTAARDRWPAADAYYMYNPYGENLCAPEDQLDQNVELGLERYLREIAAAERFLASAPPGTHLFTYNGFGGDVPDAYDAVAIERDLPYELRVWRKAR